MWFLVQLTLPFESLNQIEVLFFVNKIYNLNNPWVIFNIFVLIYLLYVLCKYPQIINLIEICLRLVYKYHIILKCPLNFSHLKKVHFSFLL